MIEIQNPFAFGSEDRGRKTLVTSSEGIHATRVESNGDCKLD